MDSTLILRETVPGWLCIDSNWRSHCLSLACWAVLRRLQLWEPAAGIKDQCCWKRQGFEDLTQSCSQPSKSDHRLWNSLRIQALDVGNLQICCPQGLCVCQRLWVPNEYTARLKVPCGTASCFSAGLSNLYETILKRFERVFPNELQTCVETITAQMLQKATRGLINLAKEVESSSCRSWCYSYNVVKLLGK